VADSPTNDGLSGHVVSVLKAGSELGPRCEMYRFTAEPHSVLDTHSRSVCDLITRIHAPTNQPDNRRPRRKMTVTLQQNTKCFTCVEKLMDNSQFNLQHRTVTAK